MPASPELVRPDVVASLQFQQVGVQQASLASPLYDAVLGAALEDVERGGPCAQVLAHVPEDLEPITDAVALRFLGAVHRLVLGGDAPGLARWFPTAGGAFDPARDGAAAGRDFVDAVEAHVPALVAGLDVAVQTNEVGRCATLAVGFTDVVRSTGLPLRLLEVGASAGLNLLWDRWRYESGATAWGADGAGLRFAENYSSPPPDVSAPLAPADTVAARRGCDRSPIDPTTEAGRTLLRSFVWPDQTARHRRLDIALAAAAEARPQVDALDAAAWLGAQLATPVEGVATVVYHSIVWQYLPLATREGVAAALDAAGEAATASAPVAWLRMEPGADPSKAAEVRLRTWPGGEERLIARTGYHGHPVWAV